MKRILLLLCLALLVFAGWPRVVAARNGTRVHENGQEGPDPRPVPQPFGFNGSDFEDGGRSPFGQ
jgi:hypothetical protein